jgi:hypothetical protein
MLHLILASQPDPIPVPFDAPLAPLFAQHFGDKSPNLFWMAFAPMALVITMALLYVLVLMISALASTARATAAKRFALVVSRLRMALRNKRLLSEEAAGHLEASLGDLAEELKEGQLRQDEAKRTDRAYRRYYALRAPYYWFRAVLKAVRRRNK